MSIRPEPKKWLPEGFNYYKGRRVLWTEDLEKERDDLRKQIKTKRHRWNMWLIQHSFFLKHFRWLSWLYI
jgi:hypothetical protein